LDKFDQPATAACSREKSDGGKPVAAFAGGLGIGPGSDATAGSVAPSLFNISAWALSWTQVAYE
jgi:hypothetical protein